MSSKNERLFELIQYLRDGETHRARDLAQRLEVSQRTLYRDMETLRAAGVPVEGTKGTGYRMSAPITLPPLNLSMVELEALNLALAVVGEAGDETMRDAARSLAAKIDVSLPEDSTGPGEGWGIATFPFADSAAQFSLLPQIRAAIRAKQKLRLLTDEKKTTIWPLAVEYWGRIWTLTGWDEDREEFRVLRLDTITQLNVLPALFVDEAGKTLADFRRVQRSKNG